MSESALSFELEGPFEAPADDYQPGGSGFRLHASRLTAGRGQVPVGKLELTILDAEQELFVNWVEVPELLRRQGIATALCQEALARWPGFLLGTSGLTDDGEEFWPTLEQTNG